MYIDPQIETIEQRPGQSPPIPLEGTIGASTRRGHHAFTTWTRVHRPNKKEPGRKLNSRFGALPAEQLTRVGAMNINAHVETIKQGPRQSSPITLKRTFGTSTRRRHNPFTAWAGVHRPHKKESCRKLNPRLGARKADHALFEWLAKGIKHHCAELAHFVEK